MGGQGMVPFDVVWCGVMWESEVRVRRVIWPFDHPGRDEGRAVVGKTRTSWKKERWRVVGACSALWPGTNIPTARPTSSSKLK
jgi:hypothetical protein